LAEAKALQEPDDELVKKAVYECFNPLNGSPAGAANFPGPPPL